LEESLEQCLDLLVVGLDISASDLGLALGWLGSAGIFSRLRGGGLGLHWSNRFHNGFRGRSRGDHNTDCLHRRSFGRFARGTLLGSRGGFRSGHHYSFGDSDSVLRHRSGGRSGHNFRERCGTLLGTRSCLLDSDGDGCRYGSGGRHLGVCVREEQVQKSERVIVEVVVSVLINIGKNQVPNPRFRVFDFGVGQNRSVVPLSPGMFLKACLY
jgi:hypothetical protein